MVDDLLNLSPGEFEDAVGEFLRARGYRDVRRVGRSGDLGVDLLCRDAAGSLVAVQCKRYAPGRAIGAPAIQQFFGMVVHHGAERGIYATTSRYTPAAEHLAQARDIELIAGDDLGRFFSQMPQEQAVRERHARRQSDRHLAQEDERLRRQLIDLHYALEQARPRREQTERYFAQELERQRRQQAERLRQEPPNPKSPG